MKRCVLSLFLVLSFGVSGDLKIDVQKESYAIGASTGSYVLNQIIRQDRLGLKTNNSEIINGFKDAIRGKLKLNDDQIISYLNSRADNLNKLKQQMQEKIKKENLDKGEKYLSINKSKKGVMQTSSGLQYEIVKKGKGKIVQLESIVLMNYKAKLIDGTVFDDTYKRKSPAHLSMINIIDGLKEGLMLMKEGAKYKLTIPSKLAYKDDGLENIPPNSVVIFEVELVKVISPGEFQKMMHKKADVKIKKKDDKKGK